MGITLGSHLVWIASIVLAGQSLSLSIPWYKYFVYVPLIYIISAVPITPGGAGLVEAFYKFFFVSAAVGNSQVVALALVVRLLDIARGLPGAVVAVSGPKLPATEAMQAELASTEADV